MTPNTPLTPNEFLAARTRVRNEDELRALAAMADDPKALKAYEEQMGLMSGAKGGMGVAATSTNLANQAQLAKMLLEHPEVFEPGPGETLRDVGWRVMNQVPGLSAKTASLGVPWFDLAKGNTSAVDLHMIRNFYPRLMEEDPEFKAAVNQLTGTMRKGKGGKQTPLTEEDAAIEVISRHPKQVYRPSKWAKEYGEMPPEWKPGDLNPNVYDAIRPERLAYEPETFATPSKYYTQLMDYIDQSRHSDIELFPEQWRIWDRKRERVEPHEIFHPDFYKLPKQSWSEMAAAKEAHTKAGYGKTGGAMNEMPWQRLYYGQATPAGMAVAGAAGAAALPYASDWLGEQQAEQKAAQQAQMVHQPQAPAPGVREVIGAVKDIATEPGTYFWPLESAVAGNAENPYEWDPVTQTWALRPGFSAPPTRSGGWF